MDYIRLSKEISYALRHHPEEYGLVLNAEGFVNINDLILAINAKQADNSKIELKDILHVIEISDKKRLEIVELKIRALYGHSTKEKIIKSESIPPDFLYHGTTHSAINKILKDGLLPMSRQYVHLSNDIKAALIVGKRRDENPIILKICAKNAYDDGIKFFIGNDDVWLADKIPAKYIIVV